MIIESVDFAEVDEYGQMETFIVNDNIFIMNGEGIEGVEEVRQWLADNNLTVPEYSSVRIEVNE
jgi:hypothetical protein